MIEFEPLVARSLVTRAGRTLALSLVAATVLLVASMVFWRLSRRAQAISSQLAQDRQLKLLGQMSAVLGHELRNPLASLKGHAQLLLEALPGDHPGRAGAETVVHEAERIEKLSGQILDFAHTGVVQRQPQDPVELARAAIEQAEVDPVELDVDNAPRSWSLDRLRMEQVLVNLLRNARQATSTGEAVGLRLHVCSARLCLEVRDRGPGIEPGDEERLFEPFFTRRVQGTGLGLALARRIVESHGGQLRAANHPAGGAVFLIELPAEE